MSWVLQRLGLVQPSGPFMGLMFLFAPLGGLWKLLTFSEPLWTDRPTRRFSVVFRWVYLLLQNIELIRYPNHLYPPHEYNLNTPLRDVPLDLPLTPSSQSSATVQPPLQLRSPGKVRVAATCINHARAVQQYPPSIENLQTIRT